jgi:succinate dehydrogenase / fumarate reductase membrane anchor subunit
MPGLVSIFHRITGTAMFLFLIPLVLFVLQTTISSEAGFAVWKGYFAHPLVKLIVVGFVWSFMHHLFAGIRYLLLELHASGRGDMKNNKQPVGAHYGWKDWMIQRVTAVVMVVYSILILGFFLVHGAVAFADWKQLFQNQFVRILSLLFFLAVFYHAWIGVRDVLMDYIKPLSIRLSLQVVVCLFLIVCSIWTVSILWGN